MATDRRMYRRIRDVALAEELTAARAFAAALFDAGQRVASALRDGGLAAAESEIESLAEKHGEKLREAHMRHALPAAVAAHTVARSATIAQQRRSLVAGAKQDALISPGFNEAAMLRRYIEVGIEEWIRDTARRETETTASNLAKILRSTWDASKDLDPITEPRDIGWVVQQFLGVVADQTEARAKLMARTTMIWSANEAAELAYADAGVEIVEWFTAEDELLCPFCAAMDGTQINIGGSFAAEGDTVTGVDADGNEAVHRIGIDVKHPPLHPNC